MYRPSHARAATPPIIAVSQHPAPSKAQDVFDALLILDSWVRPGLREADFQVLFTKCQCGLVTTKRVFAEHECLEDENDVIDLSSDTESEDFDDQYTFINLTVDSDDN